MEEAGTLQFNDLGVVLTEILDAKTKAHYLGLQLGLPAAKVDGICEQYDNLHLQDRLSQVIKEYLKKVDPHPTWKAVAVALRNPTVDLPYLAERIENKYNLIPTTLHVSDEDAELCDITQLRESFESLTDAVQKGVEDSKKGVKFLIGKVMHLPAPLRDDSDEDYLDKRSDTIHASKSVPAVFSRIGFNWDYLNPDIYRYLIEIYDLKDLNEMMNEYEKKLDKFIDCITLQEFCSVEGKKCPSKPPPGFEDHVTKHDWEPTTPLKKVIAFREECTNQYCLRKCAVWLVGMGKGCVCITLLVPKGIEIKTAGIEFYEKHAILRLDVNGSCIYKKGERDTKKGRSHVFTGSTEPTEMSAICKVCGCGFRVPFKYAGSTISRNITCDKCAETTRECVAQSAMEKALFGLPPNAHVGGGTVKQQKSN